MPFPRRSPVSSGDFALLVCAIIWGTTFLVTKQAVAQASPIAFTALRFTLAALVLLPMALRPGLASLWRARWWGISIGIFVSGGFWLQTWALTRIGPSRSAFLTSFYVFFTVLFEWLVLRRSPRRAVLAGALCALVGVGLLTGMGWGAAINAGDIATMLCAIVFAAQMVTISAALSRHPSSQILFLEVATCAVLSFPVAYLVDRPVHVTWNLPVVGAIVYLALLATVVSLSLQNFGQRHTSASRAGVVFASEPMWTAIFSAIFLGERLAARELAGAGLVLCGLLIATLVPARLPRAAATVELVAD